mgnify:CR=1 FL=1
MWAVAGGSLPVRERGLKFADYAIHKIVVLSLPVRERGLKLRKKS